MNTELFAATMRPSRILGREAELKQIKKAIFRRPGDRSCQVVFIQGAGGLGKTRILEELMCRLGHRSAQNEPCPDWTNLGDVVVLGLLDLIDIQLHSSNNLIDALYEKFSEIGIIFHHYLNKRQRHRQQVQQGVDFLTTQASANEAIQAFFQDYQELAQKRRIVWFLDTVEQLSHVTSHWLRSQEDPFVPGQKILRREDLRYQTQQWLADQIEAGILKNTTLLLAGRDKEGKAFFENITAAAQRGGTPLTVVKTERFDSPDLVRTYFKQLAEDWQAIAAAESDTAEVGVAHTIADDMAALAANKNLVQVLWLYTGGQPVLLSLFADLLLEKTIDVPSELTVPFTHAIETVGTASPDEPTLELRWQQWLVEERFIDLIFTRPRDKGATLYRDILRILVRAPRGLSAEQIHFLLDNRDNVSPADWLPERRRLREIEETIQRWMGRSTLLKRRQNGTGLQDEIYRIFAEHMAPHIYPSENVERLWDEKMSPADYEHYYKSYDYEYKVRRIQHRQLQAWARHELDKLEHRQEETQREEERYLENQLAVIAPSNPRLLNFPPLDRQEREVRWQGYSRITHWELEYMHYSLLLDFGVSFNVVYADLADERVRGYDENRDVLVQADMWRLLYDPYAMKFAYLPPRERMEKRGEKPLHVLRRVAIQEDVIRWLKRFVFVRKEYKRAIQLADAVEAIVRNLPDEIDEEKNEKESWQHTLAHGERMCWREYARLLLSEEVEAAMETLNHVVDDLVQLAQHPVGHVVFAQRGRWGEEGFVGHPADIRLQRIISLAYNYLGYGNAILRRFRQAVQCYGRALYYAREPGVKTHRAYVLNNLSRVESELGRRGRPLRLCHDALNLRREIGSDFTIALSHSTLALIYNDQNRPNEAWQAAAKAIAYARRIEDARVLGLALKHLGEALRRLAGQETRWGKLGRVLPKSPTALYEAAQDVLEEAHTLFSDPNSPASGERMRLVETKIELGCLHRDRLLVLTENGASEERHASLNSALAFLQEAANMAAALNLGQLKIDALVNQAWAYCQAGRFHEALDTAAEVEPQIAAEPLLQPGLHPPRYDAHEPIVYSQLSKLYHLRGRVQMERFRKRADEIEREYPDNELREKRQQLVQQDEEAQVYLRAAANAYVQAVVYAQLFSSRAVAISFVYDSLYGYLIKFNEQELDDFADYQQLYRQLYHADEIQLENFGMGEFLNECFGVVTDNGTVGGAA